MSVRQLGWRNNAWFVDFYFKGRRIRRPSPIQTELGAIRYERELKTKMVEADEESRPFMYWKVPTLKHFVETWRTRHVLVHNRPSTVATNLGIMEKHLLPVFGGLGLDAITTAHIDAFKESLATRGLSAKTVNNILSVLRNALQLAVDWELLGKVPKFRWLKVPAAGYRYLSEDELARLIQAAEPGYWRTLVLFMTKTGCRIGEAAGLRWEDVLLDEQPKILIRWNLVQGAMGPTKTNRIRGIPLADDLAQALRTLPRIGNHVFESNGRNANSSGSLEILHGFCETAGLAPIGWHVLRHTFASQLVANNVHLRIVQELLGHSTLEMTMRYSHVSQTFTRDAVQSLPLHACGQVDSCNQ